MSKKETYYFFKESSTLAFEKHSLKILIDWLASEDSGLAAEHNHYSMLNLSEFVIKWCLKIKN